MMLLIAPMPELGEEQAPTQVGIILPDSFDSRRPKKLIGSLIQALSLNPVTKLLGTWALQAHVEQRLRTRQHFAFLYLDLDNFKAYNDIYGFAQGDAAIRTLAGTVVAAVRERGNPGDVAAHIGGDDFAVLTTSDNAEAIAHQIIAAFDGTVPSLYSAEDRERGSITVTDDAGDQAHHPDNNIENVTGGAGDDTFVFNDGIGFTGRTTRVRAHVCKVSGVGRAGDIQHVAGVVRAADAWSGLGH